MATVKGRPSMKFAVMGVTGSGKSTFIKIASGIDGVGIGHDLKSFTQSPEPFTFLNNGTSITLVDTPGFNDTDLNESDVLKAIADWLDWDYRNRPQMRLNGIIYLHNVMDPRMLGSSLRNLKMFRDLCGQDPLRNVLLVTTRWGMARRVDMEQAERREEQLRTDRKFWAGMLAGGARKVFWSD
ncbi:hypothetical protein TI39_contig4131g00001 [Zymoseptoria brevis]|uniref:G domain-containing protein n=1 Tax=Zymoseptoria brevis TaxID=1047168 RepID=A0A0F4GCM0_9PEZI|nr:hypothetical protein TI39_contig4131g00001 [Zymoseptoria brevis]